MYRYVLFLVPDCTKMIEVYLTYLEIKIVPYLLSVQRYMRPYSHSNL